MQQLKEFRRICDERGQAEVHRLTNYSRSTISKVYHNKYDGSPDMVLQVVLQKLGGEQMQQEIPEGCMEDGQGRFVRIENVREIDMARDELVREIVGKAEPLSRAMYAFKTEIMGDISAFVELAAEKYGACLGGKKGNVTLRSYDHKYKIKLQVSEYLVFDEGLQAAKALIDDCLRKWSADSVPEIRTIINDAFQVDKEGRIATGRVLALRRLDIVDDTWSRAMSAISDSLSVAGTRNYVRVYERDDESGKFNPITLDMSGI